jgi:hypothetical protein
MANNVDSQQLKLNVLFHGTFMFIAKDGDIHALIPNIPQHANRAGNWLGETQLRGGTYELKDGIRKDGNDWFNKDQNLFVRDKKANRRPRPFATLILPKPQRITSLRVGTVKRDEFADLTDLVPNDAQEYHIATLQVFTYVIDNQNQLVLKGVQPDRPNEHYWEPIVQVRPRSKGGTGRFVNLHIFSTEDHHEEPNQKADFEACVGLIGADVAPKATFRYLPSEINLFPPNDPLPDGVDPKETESLVPRTVRMARLGRLAVQNNGDANQAWYEDDALLDGTEFCGDCVAFGGKK